MRPAAPRPIQKASITGQGKESGRRDQRSAPAQTGPGRSLLSRPAAPHEPQNRAMSLNLQVSSSTITTPDASHVRTSLFCKTVGSNSIVMFGMR